MKFSKLLIATASLLAVMGAQAQVTGSLGGGTGPILTLTDAGLSDGAMTVATLAGGAVYGSDQNIASLPPGTIGNFLAVGPDSGMNTGMLSFAGGVDYVSFLWGSPDTYNQLLVNTTGGNVAFDAASIGFTPADGNQALAKYVQFVADADVKITGLTFTNNPNINAFETSNYSITPVPEPETYALMLAGLGVVGFVARRRRAA